MRTPRILASLLALTVLCAGPMSSGADAQTEDDGAVAQKGGKKHQKRAKRPITLGRSGGNVNDFEIDPPFITCFGGTLGALLEKEEGFFILSNNHVLAMTNRGKKGDEIVQQGLMDNRCDPGVDNVVANLSGFKRIRLKKTNKVDMALAQIQEGAVAENGKILKIGIPGNETVAAQIGMRVKKAGRTTGITKGIIVLTSVVLEVEFAGVGTQESSFVKFKDQIVVEDTGGDFSRGGDSGSVIYEDVGTCPRPVGLLFAGGEGFTVANHMDTVLKVAAKIKPKGPTTLVGCTPTETTTAVAQGAVSTRPVQSPDRAEMLLAHQAQKIHEKSLLSLRGVVGVGIGANSTHPGRAVLKVLVEESSDEILNQIPAQVDGVETEVVVTGRFRAF